MDRILIPLDLYKLPDPPKRPKVPLLIDGEAVKEVRPSEPATPSDC